METKFKKGDKVYIVDKSKAYEAWLFASINNTSMAPQSIVPPNKAIMGTVERYMGLDSEGRMRYKIRVGDVVPVHVYESQIVPVTDLSKVIYDG